MNQKVLQNIYDASVNVSLMTGNVIQIKSGIMTNVDASAKVQKNINI